MFIVNNRQFVLDMKLKKINANEKKVCIVDKKNPEKILKTTIYRL